MSLHSHDWFSRAIRDQWNQLQNCTVWISTIVKGCSDRLLASRSEGTGAPHHQPFTFTSSFLRSSRPVRRVRVFTAEESAARRLRRRLRSRRRSRRRRRRRSLRRRIPRRRREKRTVLNHFPKHGVMSLITWPKWEVLFFSLQPIRPTSGAEHWEDAKGSSHTGNEE